MRSLPSFVGFGSTTRPRARCRRGYAGLERIHSLKCKALGLDKDIPLQDELPVLQFVDLTEADIKAIRSDRINFSCLLRCMSPLVCCVQVFGCRLDEAIHALR